MIQEKKKKYIIKRHNIFLFFIIIYMGDKMKVKVFDESHEKDLEEEINKFLSENDINLIDIKYSVSISIYSEEQIYCFSALLIYKDNK